MLRPEKKCDLDGFGYAAGRGQSDINGTIGRQKNCASRDRRPMETQMFERLLEPGCTESPTCPCGSKMEIATIEKLPEGTDAAIRIYRCRGCLREMRLTVWAPI